MQHASHARRVLRSVFWVAIGLGILMPRLAQACASCSSGGDDVLILYPNETWKVLVAAGRTTDYRYVEPDGSYGTAAGPVAKDAFTLAVGRALGYRGFVTLTVPYVHNVGENRGGESEAAWGLGDAAVNGRWTALPQVFTEPWLPQIQLMAGYRHSRARSMHTSAHPQLLDVFGTGFSEGRLGVDVWFGMLPWKVGFAEVISVPLARDLAGMRIRPGPALRSVVTTGYARDRLGKVVVGLVREDAAALSEDSVPVADSGRTSHALFFSLDAEITDQDSVRLSASRLAAFGSHNTSQATVVALAYMRVL